MATSDFVDASYVIPSPPLPNVDLYVNLEKVGNNLKDI